MTDIPANVPATGHAHGDDGHGDHGHDGHGHAHPKHLAHHFDTPEQQFNSGKLGMWVFLATELLMFGGLFCAYAVYRANHPEVFMYAHQYLDTFWGAFNTVVLITSSLTMAWAVRCAQLGQQRALLILLGLTLLGGLGFMMVKTVEYHHKYETYKFLGSHNKYHRDYKKGDLQPPSVPGGPVAPATAPSTAPAAAGDTKSDHADTAAPESTTRPLTLMRVGPPVVDPHKGTVDEAKNLPKFVVPVGSVTLEKRHESHIPHFEELPKTEQERVASFFGIYYAMTGLHGVHVLVGMGLIFWVLVRASPVESRKWILPLLPLMLGLFLCFVAFVTHHNMTMFIGITVALLSGAWALTGAVRANLAVTAPGEFGPAYFTPVDLVGLYWHLVDLIWIFLFPLLYLIH